MIRPCTEEDIPQITELEKLCFPICWQEKDFRYELKENPYSHSFVEEEDGKIVAFGGLWVIFERGEVTKISVHPEKRREGRGQRMLQKLIDTAEENGCEYLFLEVRPSNTAALELYRQNEFQDLRIKSDYYTDHEDALEMIRILGGEAVEEDPGD